MEVAVKPGIFFKRGTVFLYVLFIYLFVYFILFYFIFFIIAYCDSLPYLLYFSSRGIFPLVALDKSIYCTRWVGLEHDL